MMDILIQLFSLTLIISGSLILAALGEFLSEQAGILNLGIEGLMAIGAITTITFTLSGSTLWTALFITSMVGIVCGIIFATATIIFKADQALCGLAMTMLGTGMANFIGKPFEGIIAPEHLQGFSIPLFSSIPFLGPILFSQNIISYAIYCLMIPLVYYLIFKTKYGLNIRACGENPEAAHSLGIPVNRIRYIITCLGATLATIAGGYLIISTTYSWSENFIAGQGWIAIALVLLGRYQIPYIIIAGLCFGFIPALNHEAQLMRWPIPSTLLNIILYSSIIILSIISYYIPALHKKTATHPAKLAIPFFSSHQ